MAYQCYVALLSIQLEINSLELSIGTGDYPEVMKRQLHTKAKRLGVELSLPEFSQEEKQLNKGTMYTVSVCSMRTVVMVN